MLFPLRIIIGIVLAAAIAFAIYYVVYTFVVNRRIRAGVTDQKQLVDMSKIGLIAIIVVLVAICFVLPRLYDKPEYVSTRNDFIAVDISDPDNPTLVSTAGSLEPSDVSYLKMFSDEENPGYEKSVTVDGDFTFTVFTTTDRSDSFHPDFLCFVEYTGETADDLVLYETESLKYQDDDESSWSVGSGGAPIQSKLLYLGNLDGGCTYILNMYTLDGKAEAAYDKAYEEAFAADKGEFPEFKDFATSSGEVWITL